MTPSLAQHDLPADQLRLLRHYLRLARADSTRRCYGGQWRAFTRWCHAHGYMSLPATPTTVAVYLGERVHAGAAPASLNVALAAIALAHTEAGVAFDRCSPTLNLALGGMRRAHVRPQRQAEPLTGALLRQVLAGLGRTAAERRDAALLAALYVFALRPSELVALDWLQQGHGRGWLSFTGGSADLVLLGSKAASGMAEQVSIPADANPLALAAIWRWIGDAGLQPGEPLIQPVTKGGRGRRQRLHIDSIGGIVKGAMRRHYLRTGLALEPASRLAQRFSGHSGRVGLYVSASEAGAQPQHIAALARHRSLGPALRYSQRAEMIKCSPHTLPGVGV